MNTPKLLVLVRHGFSLANEVKLGDGYYASSENVLKIKDISDEDIPLTEKGRYQAIMSGPSIRQRYGMFDVVYDSGYLRAATTRQLIMQAYPTDELATMDIRESYLVRERERGYTFAMTQKQALGFFPYKQENFEVFGHFYHRAPGGQSHADMCLQVECFLEKINREFAGKKVLVVTHGHTIRAFRFVLEGWTPKRYDSLMRDTGCPVENCGVTEYQHNEKTGKLQLVSFDTVYWRESSLIASKT